MIPLPHLILSQQRAAAISGADSDSIASLTTTKSGSVSIVTRGPSGHQFTLDWGDSNSETVTHTGVGNDVTTPHTYSDASEKNISLIGDLAQITKLQLYNWGVGLYGDIVNLAELTGLVTCNLYGSRVSGNLSVFEGMLSLEYLRLAGALITGELSSLPASLTFLDLSYIAGMSKPINDLKATALTTLYFNNSYPSVTSGALSGPWAGTHQLNNCGLTPTEIDNALIIYDSAGGTGGTLKLDGGNGARTSASDAALVGLLGKGWTVTVNE